MEFSAWEPEYRAILQEFGFSADGDRAAARVLLEEMAKCPRGLRGEQATSELRSRLEGAKVLVVGGGPGVLPAKFLPPRGSLEGWKVIAADAATRTCLEAGIVPDVIVTDLDGSLPEEVEANRRGALALLHAHADNVPALRTWVPRFEGSVVGTCACEPTGGLLNPGGFTDGDRCLYLAESFGVRRATLALFDFETPWGEAEASADRKRRKLAVARRLIDEVSWRGLLPLDHVDAGGTVRPWPGTLGPARRPGPG